MNEQLDERNARTFGQIAREVSKDVQGDDGDVTLGKFLEKVYCKLQAEAMRDMREQKNKEQYDAV
jgi:hypothetical protein